MVDKNPFQVGDILHHDWGYDQTNADFYEVLHTTAKTIVIRRLRTDYVETVFMSGRERPLPGVFVAGAEALRKRVQFLPDGKAYVSFPYGWCERWDGKEKHTSSYA